MRCRLFHFFLLFRVQFQIVVTSLRALASIPPLLIVFAPRLDDDECSSSEQHRQSQKSPPLMCRVAPAPWYSAISWRSVPPREEAIRVSLPSRLESISTARVHVEVGTAGSLYLFG